MSQNTNAKHKRKTQTQTKCAIIRDTLLEKRMRNVECGMLTQERGPNDPRRHEIPTKIRHRSQNLNAKRKRRHNMVFLRTLIGEETEHSAVCGSTLGGALAQFPKKSWWDISTPEMYHRDISSSPWMLFTLTAY